MKCRLLLGLLIILGFSSIIFGQENETEENPSVNLPESVMKQVVSRILVYKFKPVNRKKTVYLAQEEIDESWLPEIRNIEFRLLSDEEVEGRDDSVYFFRKPEAAENNIYDIGFGFGDPHCDYSGDNWRFRISGNNKVRLWLDGEIGGGCGRGFGGGEFDKPGELNTYPNELKGYEFFNKGKLKDLKLAVSTRKDVKNNFGADCETSCEYDENWSISFSYFDNISKEATVNDTKIKYVPKPEYLGKFYSIVLIPKSNISFNKIAFPPKYGEGRGYAMGCGSNGSTHTSYISYRDRYGLIYEMFEEVTFTTVDYVSPRRKGDLTSIKYTIPDKLEEEMFTEQK